ncbi:MAG: ATP-binding protein [Oscillospiraceae bacterium]
MIKEKIARKLSLYFGITILLFALIVGGIFMVLFENYNVKVHRQELLKHANSIADTLSDYFDQGDSLENNYGQKSMGKNGGYGAYLKFIDDIAGTDVWIIDINKNLITSGKAYGTMNNNYTYSDLPPNADIIISDVFSGETTFSEDFSNIMTELTLTVGVPIKNSNDGIVGVVLLHSPIKDINDAISQGLIILGISGLIAFIVVLFLSVGLSYSFTKPLRKMRDTALKLINGDYTAKNNIRQNDEIGQLSNTLDLLANRLHEASLQSDKFEQMRGDFIANISHELRTPVAVMRGSLEALVDKVVTDPKMIDNYYKQMLSESKFLGRLVGDLLDLSKLQNTDFMIEKQDISLYDVLDDVIRSATHLANKKNVTIKSMYENPQVKIQGDYARLRQMLMVIMDNAIKFSCEDDIIDVHFNENVLTVRDYGIGISKEQLPYIFDRFYKSRSEHNKTGTGLGLAIAKQIAQRHNINLICESEQGKGATFIFYL